MLLRADGTIPTAAPPAPTLTAGADDLTELLRLRAVVRGTAPVSVAFAVRRASGGAWKRLAIDDTPPYRAFLARGAYPRGTKLQALAVARSLDGRTAASKVVRFAIPRG